MLWTHKKELCTSWSIYNSPLSTHNYECVASWTWDKKGTIIPSSIIKRPKQNLTQMKENAASKVHKLSQPFLFGWRILNCGFDWI